MPLLSNSGSIGLDTSGDHESIGGTENVQDFSAFVGKSGVYVFNLVIVLYFSSWADMVGRHGGQFWWSSKNGLQFNSRR
jgi:hypothetical protein